MSCWVVPSLAAELWQMPLELLWRFIRSGEIASRTEEGFTFVDMAPGGPKLARPMTPPHLRPPTFTAMARDGELPPQDPPADQPQEEPEEGFEDETASKELGDWRAARKKASRLRVPPPRQRPLN